MLVVSCNSRSSFGFLLGLASSSSDLTLFLLVDPVPALELLGVVEALEVVLAEEAAVGGLAALAHARAEVQPEVVAPPLVPVDAPPGRHRLRRRPAAHGLLALLCSLAFSLSLSGGLAGLRMFPCSASPKTSPLLPSPRKNHPAAAAADMIKRRFFRQDHGDNSATSSSSSSSGSDSDPDLAEEEEVADEEVEEQQQQDVEQAADEDSGEDEQEEEEELEQKQIEEEEASGYQSEDSSGHDVEGPSVDDDDDDENNSPMYEQDNAINLPVKKAFSCVNADSSKGAANKDDPLEADFNNYVLKCKSVYKCKLCPRIMCLSEDMVRVHLESKRHARSKKLLGNGRLKMMLNSDGELEEEAETHAERHARTIALAQQVQKPKKDSGRQRQLRRRQKKRSRKQLEEKQQPEGPAKEGAAKPEKPDKKKKAARVEKEKSDKKGARPEKEKKSDKKRRKTEK